LKAKSYKNFKKDIAFKVGVHPDMVDELITFYYAKLRKNLSSLTYPSITVTGLGTFKIRKKALNNSIIKNKSILGNIEKQTYKGYEKHIAVSEKLKELEKMQRMIEEVEKDKADFKQKKNEFKKTTKRI
jgi:hypothetical protein